MRSFFYNHKTVKQILHSSTNICFIYIRGFVILGCCLWVGNFVSAKLPITIPGSIIGLLILFFLLNFQLIPTDWIKNSCHLLMQYMTLLFVPAAMGIMDSYPLLLKNWLPILVGSLGGTIIVLLLIAYLTEYLHKKQSDRLHGEDKTL